MTKEGEDGGVTEPSQDLVERVNKTYKYVRWGLGRVGSKGDKHDSIMSHRRGHV